ncbi:hypothetical protein HAX54_004303, partial [Datura stramonium]|nr:hypothetical protein [Datura stramonium]
MHTCILLALEDYHAAASRSAIRIVPHFRDSKKDNVEAASAAIHLLKDVQVQAIFGPQMSTQTDFVIDLGNRVKVPIISPATSPLLAVKENPFFVRGALSSSSQTKAIAAIVKNYDWRQAKEAGMMSSGYAWIITDVLTSLLDLVDHSVIKSSMQGVL